MVQPLERAQRILDDVTERVLAEVPAGAVLFDAHTHLGDDIDGMRGRPDEMLAMFDRVGITGSFTFCLDEPDRVPAFSAANDRTLAYAAENPDRIVPFVRLDLDERPDRGGQRAASTSAPAGSSCTPAPRASRSATSASTTSSRSRSSATSRS